MPHLILYGDGGSRGNPGPGASGAVLYDAEKNVVGRYEKYLGHTTNNQAEYEAVILGMQKAQELGATELDIFLDSQLVVKQLKQEFRIKDKKLQPLFVKAWNLMQGFKKVSITHIPRSQNKEADKLVNIALDRQQSAVS